MVFEYSTEAIVVQQTRHARNGGARSLHTMCTGNFHFNNISGLCGAESYGTVHGPGVTDFDCQL